MQKLKNFDTYLRVNRVIYGALTKPAKPSRLDEAQAELYRRITGSDYKIIKKKG